MRKAKGGTSILPSIRAPLLALLLPLLSACSDLPYRVEWAFGKDSKEQQPAASPVTPVPEESTSVTREQAWMAWEALHDELARLLAKLESTRPVPHAAFAKVLRGLDRLGPFEPEDQQLLAAERAHYVELESSAERLPPLLREQKMRDIRREILRACGPMPPAPAK